MRPTSPGPRSTKSPSPVVLAVHLDHDIRPELEQAAAAYGLRVLAVRHLHAACTALASNDVALVLAGESTRPWDREVLVEHASKQGVTVLWTDSHLSSDGIQDALHGLLAARGRAPHSRSG